MSPKIMVALWIFVALLSEGALCLEDPPVFIHFKKYIYRNCPLFKKCSCCNEVHTKYG